MYLKAALVAQTQALLADINRRMCQITHFIKSGQWGEAEQAFLDRELWRNFWRLIDAPTPELQLIVARLTSLPYEDAINRIVQNLRQLGNAISAKP